MERKEEKIESSWSLCRSPEWPMVIFMKLAMAKMAAMTMTMALMKIEAKHTNFTVIIVSRGQNSRNLVSIALPESRSTQNGVSLWHMLY